ncbi:hypothetical protein GPECTOR_6g612 [Gonium pectorale]|uniref:EamA domain-containing protein n=1 Tax=Gonium pectorale TaxID=33097 RepID=A0A150GV05_GONPE|nr:hypothetical protein GPECTOR_6g612 [Gonium pectorale]|eukprot:KXZ53695.1 hypothetical protein GPECTOR_6g612 [Gonium pectorale]
MIYIPIGAYARKRARVSAAARAAKAAVDGSDAASGPDCDGEADAEASDPMLPGGSKAAGRKGCRAGPLGGAGRNKAATKAGAGDVERQPLLVQAGTQQSADDAEGRGRGVQAEGPEDGGAVEAAVTAEEEQEDEQEVGMRQIARAAVLVAPVWFAAQLTFTASLEFTSVTSNTVLSSCSSLFVYLGSLALGQEAGSALRLASVLAAMAGTALVALGDSRAKGGDAGGEGEGGGGNGGGGGSAPLLGDCLTLLAAALYAAYTLIMKRMLVKDDGAVTALFFGVIGALCFAVLVPLAGGLALAGSDVVLRVTGGALGLALVQGLVDYVAADYAWARAVMLLGPTATSCGLAIQIPAAAIVDSLVNGKRLAWSDTPASLAQFAVGSVLIVGGFIGVSLDPRVGEATWQWWTARRGRGAGSGGESDAAQGGWQLGKAGAGNGPGAEAEVMEAAGRAGALDGGTVARGQGPGMSGGVGAGVEPARRQPAWAFGGGTGRLGSEDVSYIPLSDTTPPAGARS